MFFFRLRPSSKKFVPLVTAFTILYLSHSLKRQTYSSCISRLAEMFGLAALALTTLVSRVQGYHLVDSYDASNWFNKFTVESVSYLTYTEAR